MKKLLTILCLVLLVSCSNEVPPDQLVERQGITYEVNSTTPFTGSSVGYHDNDQLSVKGNYKNGEKDGLWEGYYENGQLKYRGNYKDGKKDGLWEYFDENGKKDGLWETFDEEGNLTDTKESINGEMFDIKFEYSENGQLEEKTYYKEGKEVSKTRFFYYDNGQLKYFGNYKDGTENGLWEEFYENGQLEVRVNWKDGTPIKIEQYKDGVLQE